jgi:hypothetical protein
VLPVGKTFQRSPMDFLIWSWLQEGDKTWIKNNNCKEKFLKEAKVLGRQSFPAYYEKAKRTQDFDQMPYTSRTIATGQVCLAISAKFKIKIYLYIFLYLNADCMFMILKQLNAAIIWKVFTEDNIKTTNFKQTKYLIWQRTTQRSNILCYI